MPAASSQTPNLWLQALQHLVSHSDAQCDSGPPMYTLDITAAKGPLFLPLLQGRVCALHHKTRVHTLPLRGFPEQFEVSWEVVGRFLKSPLRD